METRCHLGEVIKYDTVGVLKWGVSITTHTIKVVVEQVLSAQWKDDNGTVTDKVPTARRAVDVEGQDGVCTVCFALFSFDFPGTNVVDFRTVLVGNLVTLGTRRRRSGGHGSYTR